MLAGKVDLTMPADDLAKLYLLEPLDLVNLAQAVDSSGNPVPYTLTANYYIRPVIDNVDASGNPVADSSTLPHEGVYAGSGETVTETLWLYGPKPKQGSTQDAEDYTYYDLGTPVLKITPTSTTVYNTDGSVNTSAPTGLQNMYDGGDNLGEVIRTQTVKLPGTYTAVIERPNGFGQEKLVDMRTIVFNPLPATIHIRQVIQGTVPDNLTAPTMGYMTLQNFDAATPDVTAASLNITTNSGPDSASTGYTTYKLSIAEWLLNYRVVPIDPQYFTYEGYTIDTGSSAPITHGVPQPGYAVADYFSDVQTEYWVTVYYKATTDKPTDNNTWPATNQFGEIG
jgi:hypothetical protein